VGTVIASPMGDIVKLIVVENGDARVGEWVAEERNVRGLPARVRQGAAAGQRCGHHDGYRQYPGTCCCVLRRPDVCEGAARGVR
jgi:hypothetical protein